ncbi:hypothetical protein [Kribbella catacumbae]|uniref:hypothetical protein n=1 Tax=Kribbella catacumbae TaxID=460086 RepID=UPI000369F4C3|nr:hypothetical protein [Kribbella catacumbae]
MRNLPRTGGLAVTVLAAVGTLALSGCGSDDTPAGGDATSTPVTSNTPSATPTAVPSTPTAPPSPPSKPASSTPASTADVTVDVSIAGGKISAGGKTVIKANSGQTVRINGVSDVAESLHVHGYDKTVELKPGKPASLEFKTDAKGTFEVESHESGKLVFKLQVS